MSPEAPVVLLLCCLICRLRSRSRPHLHRNPADVGRIWIHRLDQGCVAAGFSIGYCLGLLPTGAASSIGSPKKVLLGGLIFWSLAQAASPAAAAASVPALLFARAMMGVGEAAAVPSLQAVAARFVPAEQRSFFWGCLTASLSFGTISAYKISPPLIASFGWPSAF